VRPIQFVSDHFPGDGEDEPPVIFIHAAKQVSQLAHVTSTFAETVPNDIVRNPAFGQVRESGWYIPFIEQPVERQVQRPSHFLQCFDGRNGVTVFDAAYVTAAQPTPFFDIASGKMLFFAQSPQAVANEHLGYTSLLKSSPDFFWRAVPPLRWCRYRCGLVEL
jgi:hypothetical protein